MAPRMNRAAQRAALLELGAAVAEEMRAGQAGVSSGTVGDVLATMPQASLEIVGLIGREARRRQPDPHLMAALTFLAGQALQELRYGVERADPDATATLEALRGRLVADARSDKADPTVLMLVTKQFAAARLDIGDALRHAMGDILDVQAEDAAEIGGGDLDMDRHLSELGRELGGDAFAIHLELSETAASFPVEHRVSMASFMLASDSAPVRDAALGWLCDPEPEVRAALAAALREEAKAGRLDGTALRRLVALRNWMPAAERPRIDEAVRAARLKGGEPSPLPRVRIEEMRASGFDGSGATSAFALVRSGARYALVSLLFKLGTGIRDAWVHRDLGRAEAHAELDRIEGEIDLVPASAATLRRALSHGLAVGEGGPPPPFGALDAVEALGLGPLNPEETTPEEIVAEVLGEAAVDVTAVLADSADWPSRYAFLGSWFEDDAEVDAALQGRKGLSRLRKIDLLLERVVAPRRRRWGEMLAWTALITADAEDAGEALAFAVTAREILGDRPAGEIPLLRAIAEGTLEARRLRRP